MLRKRIKYWLFRHKHGYPSTSEVADDLAVIPDGFLSLRVIAYAQAYHATESIYTTADAFSVTSERVRQVLWKIHRCAARIRKHGVESERRYLRLGGAST